MSWSDEVLAEVSGAEGYGRLREEDEMCDLVYSMSSCLQAKRICRLLPMLCGWPRMFVMLLDPDRRPEYLERLRTAYEDFLYLKSRREEWAASIVKRSPFQQTCVMQVVRILEVEGWGDCSEKLLQLLARRCSRLIVTQLTEDAINRVKRAIDKSKNEVATEQRLWGTLVDKQILGSVHRFAEVDRSNEPSVRRPECPPEWFKVDPMQSDFRKSLTKILDGGASPAWYCPGAPRLAVPHVEALAVRALRASGKLSLAPKLWLACLVRSGTLCVRRKSGDARWWFAVDDCFATAAILRPAKLLESAAGRFFVAWMPEDGAAKPFEIVPLVEPQAWVAVTTQTVCPLRLAMAHSHKGLPCTPEDCGFLAREMVGEPKPLLEVCASEAFFELPLSTLQDIAAEVKLKDPCSESLSGTIVALARKILKCSDEAAANILLKRCAREESSTAPLENDIAQLEEVTEAFDAQEKEDLQNTVSSERSRSSARVAFAREAHAARKELMGVRGTVSASSRNPRSPLAGHKVPPELPPQARLQSEAKTLLPPGAHIWQGRQSGTWQSHIGEHRRFSQSWTAAGSHDEACLNAIRDTWRKCLADNHMKVTQCPIKGLFGSAA